MKYARIKDGQLVTATTIHDAQGTHDANAENPTVPDGWQIVESEANANELDASGYSELTRRQVRFALLELGITAAMVDAVIAQIPDEAARETAMIYWQDTNKYTREHPMIAQIAAALGITEEQLNAAWGRALVLDREE